MPPTMERPAFAFAMYDGKTQGLPVKWLCYNGVFSVSMNPTMRDLIIDTIEAGGDVDGDVVELDDEVVEFLDGLENCRTCKKAGSFRIVVLGNVYTIMCDEVGLRLLCDAIDAGANYDESNGNTLWAFVQSGRARIEVWGEHRPSYGCAVSN